MSAYDCGYRLMAFQDSKYLKLRELCRFYERIEDSRKSNQVQLHTELQQTFPELEQLFVNRTSKLALNIINLFPHPDFCSWTFTYKIKKYFVK